MNKPVSYKLAKLLKEKGFYKPLPSICFIKEEYNYTSTMVYEVLDMNFEYILRPTIEEVVMWLYEKHGIWISVHSTRGYFVGNWTFHNTHKGGDTNVFSSPTEAYEAVIEYTLNNLI